MSTSREESGIATIALIGIVLAVLAGGAGVAYVATDGFGSNSEPSASVAASGTSDGDESEDTAEEPTSEATPEATPEEVADDGVGDISEAITGGTPMTCTFSQAGVAGTSYFKSSSVFRFDVDTPQGMSHLLAIDGTFHVWGAGLPQGITVKDISQTPGMANAFKAFTPEQIESLPKSANVQCKRYTGSGDVFKLPGGVSFTSMPGS